MTRIYYHIRHCHFIDITVTQILLYWTLLFHNHVSLIHGYAIPLDTVISYICITATRILCTQLFHILITLLHKFTCIPPFIVSVFLLQGLLFMLPEIPLLEYSCTPVMLYSCSCYCIADKFC